MKRHRHTKLYKEECLWFFAVSVLLLAIFVCYIYFLSASVHHVVMRKEISQEIAEKNSYVSRLESQYIEAQHTVSEAIASRHGYVDADRKVFIERRETSLVLSENTGR